MLYSQRVTPIINHSKHLHFKKLIIFYISSPIIYTVVRNFCRKIIFARYLQSIFLKACREMTEFFFIHSLNFRDFISCHLQNEMCKILSDSGYMRKKLGQSAPVWLFQNSHVVNDVIARKRTPHPLNRKRNSNFD